MATHPRLAGYLNQALRHELTAVQHYLTQSRLCRLWGLMDQANWLQKEAQEELGHAGQIIDHLLVRGFSPHSTHLDPARPGRDFLEMLQINRQLEWQAILLYDEALQSSQQQRDHELTQLFGHLLHEEQQHLQELDILLAESSSGGLSGNRAHEP